MPLYEYQCDACGNRFEKIVKFSDPPLEACPSCGGKVQKLVSSPAIQFKGTGWYITDYAKKSSPDGSNTGKGSSDSSGDKTSSTDSTPKTDTSPKADAPAAAATTSSKE